ncbi:hypothetical protein V5799_004521, partial [Amblyomma americanum]
PAQLALNGPFRKVARAPYATIAKQAGNCERGCRAGSAGAVVRYGRRATAGTTTNHS